MDKTEALSAFMALGQPTRLDVVRVLIAHEPDGMLAGQIAEALAIRSNTLSPNLTILRNAGLVVQAREGRGIRYRADLENVRMLIAYLLEECCGAQPEICRPILATIGLHTKFSETGHERAYPVHGELGAVDPR